MARREKLSSLFEILRLLLQQSDTTTPEYFVGTINEENKAVANQLSDSALAVSYISYPKTLYSGERAYHSKSEWVYRDSKLSEYQLHVILFEVNNRDPTIYVFCHHEYNWIRHPIKHLRQSHLGSGCKRERVIELFEDAGVQINRCADVSDEAAKVYCSIRDNV